MSCLTWAKIHFYEPIFQLPQNMSSVIDAKKHSPPPFHGCPPTGWATLNTSSRLSNRKLCLVWSSTGYTGLSTLFLACLLDFGTNTTTNCSQSVKCSPKLHARPHPNLVSLPPWAPRPSRGQDPMLTLHLYSQIIWY